MLLINNVEIFGLERSIKASGNPMTVGEIHTQVRDHHSIDVPTNNDNERAKTLGKAKSGSGHDNFLKGIIVQFDVKYPQYWTPEAQRYNWLQIISSQSKMHRLTTMGMNDNFSSMFNKYVDPSIIVLIKQFIHHYNCLCEFQLSEETCDYYHVDHVGRYQTKEELDNNKYYYFMKALSNLPMGFEMWETLSTNYLQLKTIYNQRKNHKLKEDWGAFIEMCDKLPRFKELTGV
jgi:hypothetical protein